ncbi:pimeloyl-ACP methyl ester carboxylesterase [Kitasatospora sp. MAA19]|uniref:alpha/beta hydrolase n=1 Tax=Kitasatospora sp. MAA19 TaxID=3035090 RepID=UPI0024759C4C|nr:alpha/beta hydrolase [Kitasatospora sp. MAA19]MDH6711260.1 pimeloyl-ACP methyl ester carboxylesterase [Kitasatospora sp. MAA19]
MPNPNRTLAAVTAAAALVVTVLAAQPAAAAGPGADAAGASRLAWSACPGQADARQQCTTLAIPLDYADPDGPQITLAVSRIAAAKPGLRHGVLLIIPGGPGDNGLDRPAGAAKRLPQSVLDRYDLVGFDPRGVGRSTPVSCGLETSDLAMVKLRPWPAADGSIDENLATARRVAETCARNGGPVLRSLSTRNEARDIDRIRQALGERRLSAWGTSYGTYAGAVYATMFPRQTDRIVLDSNDDPDPSRVGRGWLAAFGQGAEDRFPDFAEWASAPGNPDRVADTPEEVRPLFLDLAARLDAAPLPWPGANPAELSGNVLREAMLQSLYADGAFPDLARLMLAGLGRRPLPAPVAPPEEVLQNHIAASAGTLCNDVAWPADPAAYRKDVAAERAARPLTAGMPVNVMPCAFWPFAPAEPPVRVTGRGPANILLAQNLRDPATPYWGALKLRAALGDRARMVTVDSGGHDVYLANGNACGDAVVTDFLVTGRRPAEDVRCPAG